MAVERAIGSTCPILIVELVMAWLSQMGKFSQGEGFVSSLPANESVLKRALLFGMNDVGMLLQAFISGLSTVLQYFL